MVWGAVAAQLDEIAEKVAELAQMIRAVSGQPLPGGAEEVCEHPLDQMGDALPGSGMGHVRKRCGLCGQIVTL